MNRADPFAPSKKMLGYKTVMQRPDAPTTAIDIPKDFVKFNEFIGNPIHPATQEQMPLTPYQLDFFRQIDESSKHMYHLNKARQMGFTELVIRILLFYACTKYPPGKIIIMAGTRLDTTKDIFQRLLSLIQNIRPLVVSAGPTGIILTTCIEIIPLPAQPEATTGLTKIRAFLLDESTKWNRKDDTPVMNSVMPIVRSNKSDLFMISTPKGPRGFFYDIGENHDDDDFLRIKYSIWATEGNLYSTEEINALLNSTAEDPKPEYLNEYVAGRDSIFGSLSEEDEDDSVDEWK